MKKNLLGLCLLFVLSYLPTLAQDRTISGHVTASEDGSALPGVTIAIKNTQNGTTTDSKGNYRLAVTNNATLVFSAIGFATQEIAVGTRSTLNIELTASVGALDEVVVVAYGSQDRRSITGAQTSIKGGEVTKATLPAVTEQLQGKVAGLQASAISGAPGSNTPIRIRGIGSITAGADPLYVVDGVIINAGDLSRVSSGNLTNALAGLNPNDIEDVTVLKDASSASIYGSRAANGVILITTKKGRSGPTRFSANAEIGYTDLSIPSVSKPLNKADYLTLTQEGLVNSGATPAQITNTLALLGAGNPETNWLDLVTRRGQQQTYDIRASGGDNKTTFSVSGGYFKQQATTIGSQFERFSAAVSLSHNASQKLSFRLNLNPSVTQQNNPNNGGAFANPILAAYFLRPTQNAYDAKGILDYSTTTFPGTYNPVALVQYNKNSFGNLRGIGSGRVEYRPIKNLALSSQYGIDYNNIEENFYRNPFFGDGRTANGSAFSYYTRYFNWTWTNLAEYRLNLNSENDFFVDLKAGYEAQKSQGYFISAYGEGFPNTSALTSLAVAATPKTASQNGADFSFASLISNAFINYKNKYTLSGSFRRDGSSRFGANNRFGNFYSVGAAWNIDQEEFMRNNTVVSALKLRASYGVNGNAAIGNYQWRATYGYGSSVNVNGFTQNLNYNSLTGSAPNSPGNPDLTWELNKPFDVGIDAGFLNNRLNVVLDYYSRTTSQLLLNVPLSRTSGFSSTLANAGAMVNSGLEVTINAAPLKGAFTWNINLNAAFNQNKIKTLYNGLDILDGSFIRREGQNFQTFYLREWAGVDPANGDPLWYKNVTNADGSIDRSTTNSYNAAQRVLYKTASPKVFGGFNNTFSFKGITLDAQINYNFGNYVQDTWANYLFGDGYNAGFNKVQRQMDRWQKPGDITDVPKYIYNNSNQSYGSSTRYLYKGDFIRLRAVTLSYDLPQSLVGKGKLSQARFYVRGTNLFTKTFDKNLPFDPELGITGQSNLNIFISKVVTAGINIGF
ncbi:SusC/RagA family TonB-linked outer membrane protein [Spirosoma aerophilum]